MMGDAMNIAGREMLCRVLVVDGDRDRADNLRDTLASERCEVALAHGADYGHRPEATPEGSFVSCQRPSASGCFGRA